MIDVIHSKLQVWSDWFRSRQSGALGFKASSINLWYCAPDGAAPDYVPQVLDAKQVEECLLIEALVTGRKGRIPKVSREVVAAYYLDTRTAVQHAKDFKVHKDTFYQWLHNAHVQIGAALDNQRMVRVARGAGVICRQANKRVACNEENA